MEGLGGGGHGIAIFRGGGLINVGGEVIEMATNVPPPSSKGVRDRALDGDGVATLVVEVLLEVGGFDVD